MVVVLLPGEFDAIVEQALARIPKEFRDLMSNIAVVVEPEPPRRGLLGLYQGRPMHLRSVHDAFAMPDRITIYQGPHERLAQSREHLERMVYETVWHEIAHYFGMNEVEVRQAERRRGHGPV